MAQTRIFYATQAVKVGDTIIKGLQSVGLDTTFNLEQAFELGQLSLYENIEGIPDISMTLQKVLDGTPLLWHTATKTDTAYSTVANNTFTARGDSKLMR